MPASYNTGDETDRRKALDGIFDFTKLLISLATGTVVLSATFLEKFYKGVALNLLIASWASLGASVVLGLIAAGAYIAQLAESDIRPRRSALEILNLLEWLFLIGGITALAVFTVKNVTHS